MNFAFMKRKSTLTRFLFIAILSTLVLLSSNAPLAIHREYKVKTIVIDAGHGGKDPGCLGATTTREKEIVLATALELGRLIKQAYPDVNIIYTRDTDKFIELHERSKIANKNAADLFISLHCNAGSKEAYGTETFVMGAHKSEAHLEVAKKENSAILLESNRDKNYDGFDPNSDEQYILLENFASTSNEHSIALATKIENQFKNKLGRHSRGVKQAGLLVLWRSTMPSVLIEMGFLSNKTEETYLNNKDNRNTMANAIFKAIKEYKTELEK